MKVALVHDWLNGMRGGEKCLEVLCEIFPESPVYTLFAEPDNLSESIRRHPIRTSWIQGLPGVQRHYRYYLPFFPHAVESLDLRGYDLIVSTSHCVAKGVRKSPSALHLCYCFTPMRYAWGFFEEYFGSKGQWSQRLIGLAMSLMREWDKRASSRVDHFIGISEHIRRRILSCYGREAEVIYPPAATDFYQPSHPARSEDFYLIVSALVPYKRIDLAVRAFKTMGKKLVIIGNGPDRKNLEKIAGPETRFLGWQSDETLRDYYQKTKALIFPGEEDFGIVPVEVQACGKPVVAYARGGALETVIENRTGVFFDTPTEESLIEAISRCERINWDPEKIRENALRFSRKHFKESITAMIRLKTKERGMGFHAAAA